MDIKPDFERFRKAVHHQEPDRVPLCEALVGYGIMSKFLGREVTPDDIASQVEFWSKAGYDFVPMPVSLMVPGKVTEESKITRVLREMVLAKNPAETNPDAWNLELSSFIHEREDFERFPWEAASEIEFDKLEALENLLPEKMKAIAEQIGEHKPDLLGLSALLTTTMPEMQNTLDMLEKKGLRDHIKVVVGGAPVDQDFADAIKADGFGKDATEAVMICKQLLAKA